MLSDTDKVSCNIKKHKFDNKQRLYVFAILAIINTLVNMDHGTIPAASNEIKKDLKINEAQLGTFGSLVYFGNLLGALLLTRLIDVIDRKVLTIVTTIISAILIYSFTKVSFLWFLLINRILVGIVQIFITIYFPVWIDQFGPKNWKITMMSIFTVSSPLGVMFGYMLTMSVKLNLDVRLIFNLKVESFLYYTSNSSYCCCSFDCFA